MTYAEFVRMVRNLMLQNVGKDMYDDSDFIRQVSFSLLFLYMLLNQKQRWFYNSVEEVLIAPTSSTVEFPTTHKMLGVINDLKHNARLGNAVFAGIDTTGTELEFAGYFFDAQDNFRYTYLKDDQVINGFTFKGIKTSRPQDSVYIRYVRAPRLPLVSDTADILIDCPFDLLSALRWHVMSSMYTSPYLESGANMAQYWYQQFISELDVYASSYGLQYDTNAHFRLDER